MRKAINTAALIVFIWLVIDAFQIHNFMLGLLLAGVIPGTNLTLPPLLHLGLLTLLTVVALLEIFSENYRISKYIRDRIPTRPTRA